MASATPADPELVVTKRRRRRCQFGTREQGIAQRNASRAEKMTTKALTFYADILPTIIEQRKAGWTLWRIANTLNDAGRKTVCNSPFSPSTLLRIIDYPNKLAKLQREAPVDPVLS